VTLTHVYTWLLFLGWLYLYTKYIYAGALHGKLSSVKKTRSYRMKANRSSINTYIYILSHNLCKMQVFKLVVLTVKFLHKLQ